MNAYTRIDYSRYFMRLAALVVFLVAFAPAAEASNLGVMVRAAMNDASIQGARVCVGTAAATSQFGSGTTADTGVVNIMNIPNDVTSLVVTVNKSGFKGAQQTVTLFNTGDSYNQTARVYLELGSGGPACTATLAPPPKMPLKINNFQINGGQATTTDRTVKLDVSHYGDATHYQVSESSEFAFAAWKEMPAGDSPVTYNFDSKLDTNLGSIPNPVKAKVGEARTLPTKPSTERFGNKTLYFRLKNSEAVTDPKSDSIELKPKTQSYSVAGSDLIVLLKNARDEWGFSFSVNITAQDLPGCSANAGLDKIDFDNPGLNMGISSGVKTTEYHFLQGRNLNRYWKIKDVVVAPQKDYLSGKTGGTNFTVFKESLTSPHFFVRLRYVSPPAGAGIESDITNSADLCFNARMLSLVLITLEGPENMQWQDAFRQ